MKFATTTINTSINAQIKKDKIKTSEKLQAKERADKEEAVW